MMLNDYLRTLRKQLKGFSTEEQAALIEEIGTHFESGEENPELGKDPEQRNQKLLSEMGPPSQLGRGFRNVHRPGRVVDFLLIMLPTLFAIIIARSASGHWLVASSIVKLSLFFSLISLLMVVVSILRHSLYLKLYWVTAFAIWLIYLLQFLCWKYFQNYQQGLTIIIQPGYPYFTSSFTWLAPWAEWVMPTVLQLALVLAVIRMIWSARQDLLTLVYACLLTYLGILSFYRSHLDQSVLSLFHISSAYGASTLAKLGWLVFLGSYWYWIELGFLGIFVVSSKREVRWLALGAYVIAYGILDVLTIRISGYWVYLFLVNLLLPLAVVLTGWYLEKRRKLKWQSTL